MWVKTTCCNSSLSSFQLENFFYNILLQYFYQYAGCNLQRATTLSRFLASPRRELQPPLALALAKILVRRCWPTEGYNLLFQGPHFINFQTGSININQSSRINQSPFHQLDLNQVDASLTVVPKTQYQKPHTRH